MAWPSKREKYHFYNSLVCVVKSLEGQYTTFDLHNEACLTGKIKHVDGYMNIDLEDAVFYDSRGSVHPFETFFVRARLIRYVHIPKNLSAVELIENQCKNMAVKRRAKVHTYKTARAKRYQKEIVDSLLAEEATKEDVIVIN